MNTTAQISGCPACATAPLAQDVAERCLARGNIVLSLPGIHCAACIGAVERRLMAEPGVRAARVNLSRKRVTVDASGITADMLVNALAEIGYEAHELDSQMISAVETDAAGRALLMRLAVAGFAMMNVMLFSVAVWSGASDLTQEMFHWISAAIAVPALIYAAQVFFRSAWSALRVARLNMDVPISLAIILAAIMSVYETAQGGTHVYFDAALSLTFFLLVGRYLDHRMRVAARSAAQELTALELPRAIRVRDGARETVEVNDLAIGDHVAVTVGTRLPVEGCLIEGRTDMDRALLTGESLPVAVAPGAQLAAGEVNLSGPVVIEVTATGEDTTLRRMAALVEVAEGARNRYTALADRAARVYAPVVHILALATFVGWITASGDMVRALNIAISVLIITCPCALGLAVPAVMTAASGRLFRRGLLVKTATAIERLAEADTVVFDKTGTLTTGHARLDPAGLSADELCVLKALCQGSEHPVARALLAAVPSGITPACLEGIKELPGRGIKASWNGQPVRLGRGDWVGGDASPSLKLGQRVPKALNVAEILRDGAAEAVEALRALGLEPKIFTGDTERAAADISAQLGGLEVLAGMSPQDKQAEIARLADTGNRVLMVGDGLNDTVALAQAHVSISPASALDASRAASDIVLLGSSLANIPEAVRTARRARARVLENFSIAAGYNMIAIPIAVLGFATPLSAAIAMSASSITVLLNALRVR